MCDCNRILLEEKKVEYQCFDRFNSCLCQEDNKILAIECEKCWYNVFGFFWNYFYSVNCSCWSISKDVAYSHCRQLVQTLNVFFRKVCIESKNVPKELKIEKNGKYLMRVLKTDPFYYYSEEENAIQMSIDSPELTDFFEQWNYVTCVFNI